ncbi:unnamed protein product [Rangifer tarandus platyrhynchus]|uniref:Uncharacterized protein n=2 Tax=Rangifer tarandus platyrhynchus TaxID=3082113 RepID=A0AC59YDV8_RANTA|nr:unnamed protein product [Rangifer tarandus platyrhynchus]
MLSDTLLSLWQRLGFGVCCLILYYLCGRGWGLEYVVPSLQLLRTGTWFSPSRKGGSYDGRSPSSESLFPPRESEPAYGFEVEPQRGYCLLPLQLAFLGPQAWTLSSVQDSSPLLLSLMWLESQGPPPDFTLTFQANRGCLFCARC